MAKGFSITAGLNQVRVFQCPHCKETSNTAARQCPFCSTPIDPQAAEAAAEVMAKVNQACSDASYLRITAGSMAAFFGLSLLPIVATIGYWGLTFLVFAIPVLAIRWWIRFGSIRTDDSGFRAAKRATLVSIGIWALGLIVWIVRVGLVPLS
jgi:hypothetical protein